jgi:hypothetical protein
VKILEMAGLVLGLCEGVLGVVCLAFRWEPRWLGRGRPRSFPRGMMELFGGLFIVAFLLPKIVGWHGATASASALAAVVSFLLFLAFGFGSSASRPHRKTTSS